MGPGKAGLLRRYLKLVHGIPSHDTFGRLFGLIDASEFEASFRRWVRSILPALGTDVVAIDGKTSRRSGGVDTTALPQAIASKTLMFVPAETSRGIITTCAFA